MTTVSSTAPFFSYSSSSSSSASSSPYTTPLSINASPLTPSNDTSSYSDIEKFYGNPLDIFNFFLHLVLTGLICATHVFVKTVIKKLPPNHFDSFYSHYSIAGVTFALLALLLHSVQWGSFLLSKNQALMSLSLQPQLGCSFELGCGFGFHSFLPSPPAR